MNAHEATFRIREHGYRFELFPVHSPLLGESYLVSYPPLTYMLKFGGVANLSSCLNLSLKQDHDSKIQNAISTSSKKLKH